MVQHVLRAKSPADRAREAYFQGRISTAEYLQHALKACKEPETAAPRTRILGMRQSLLHAFR